MKFSGLIAILALIIILMPVAGVYLLALAAPAGKLLGVPMLVVGIILWALVFSDFGRKKITCDTDEAPLPVGLSAPLVQKGALLF